MNTENTLKIIAFINALADILVDAGMTTNEKLDELSREKEKLLYEQLGIKK